jgi:hypothetical protein
MVPEQYGVATVGRTGSLMVFVWDSKQDATTAKRAMSRGAAKGKWRIDLSANVMTAYFESGAACNSPALRSYVLFLRELRAAGKK